MLFSGYTFSIVRIVSTTNNTTMTVASKLSSLTMIEGLDEAHIRWFIYMSNGLVVKTINISAEEINNTTTSTSLLACNSSSESNMHINIAVPVTVSASTGTIDSNTRPATLVSMNWLVDSICQQRITLIDDQYLC